MQTVGFAVLLATLLLLLTSTCSAIEDVNGTAVVDDLTRTAEVTVDNSSSTLETSLNDNINSHRDEETSASGRLVPNVVLAWISSALDKTAEAASQQGIEMVEASKATVKVIIIRTNAMVVQPTASFLAGLYDSILASTSTSTSNSTSNSTVPSDNSTKVTFSNETRPTTNTINFVLVHDKTSTLGRMTSSMDDGGELKLTERHRQAQSKARETVKRTRALERQRVKHEAAMEKMRQQMALEESKSKELARQLSEEQEARAEIERIVEMMRREADQMWMKVRRASVEVNKTKHELDSCRAIHPRLRQALDRERQMYTRLAWRGEHATASWLVRWSILEALVELAMAAMVGHYLYDFWWKPCLRAGEERERWDRLKRKLRGIDRKARKNAAKENQIKKDKVKESETELVTVKIEEATTPPYQLPEEGITIDVSENDSAEVEQEHQNDEEDEDEKTKVVTIEADEEEDDEEPIMVIVEDDDIENEEQQQGEEETTAQASVPLTLEVEVNAIAASEEMANEALPPTDDDQVDEEVSASREEERDEIADVYAVHGPEEEEEQAAEGLTIPDHRGGDERSRKGVSGARSSSTNNSKKKKPPQRRPYTFSVRSSHQRSQRDLLSSSSSPFPF